MTKNFPLLRGIAYGVLLLCTHGSALAQQDTTYQYQYDAMGNLTQITDPLGRITNQQYDALNRVRQQLQPVPAAGSARPVIQYAYDGLDQLIAVIDPRNLATNYEIDGLGNRATLVSPDTGATHKTYDAAGNVLSSTDAKGQFTSYAYDLLNRIKSIHYADGNIVTYEYDQGPNALGRLTQVSDANGTTAYGYDQRGHVTTETRQINSGSYTTHYSYDAVGQLMSETYPSGRVVTYSRDGLGRIHQIDTTKDGNTQTLVSEVTYHPFGGVKSFVNGAGKTITRTIDLDGRINSYAWGSQLYSITYDAASRIRAISDSANPSNTQNYGYDDLDRLTSYSGVGGNQSFDYDLTGNRTSKIVGVVNASYSISPVSNRLMQVNGSQNVSYGIDPNGSVTDNGNNQFNYDARGRMNSATTVLGPVQYKVNALGQRVAKTVQGITTIFHYDQSGMLIAESDEQGAVKKEYVYLGTIPVAVLQ